MKREHFGPIGALIGCSTVIGFAIALLIRNIPQNIVTWILWAILEGLILAGSISAKNKRPWLPAAYTFGSISVMGILFSKGVWAFGIVELIATIGCIIAIFLWFIAPKWTIVSSTVAMVVAGIPALFDIIRVPNPASWWLWFGCALAGLLTAISAKSWKIEDRFMPVTSFIYNFLMFIFVLVR